MSVGSLSFVLKSIQFINLLVPRKSGSYDQSILYMCMHPSGCRGMRIGLRAGGNELFLVKEVRVNVYVKRSTASSFMCVGVLTCFIKDWTRDD